MKHQALFPACMRSAAVTVLHMLPASYHAVPLCNAVATFGSSCLCVHVFFAIRRKIK